MTHPSPALRTTTLLAGLVALAAPSPLTAQDVWVGAASANWSNGPSWQGGTAPPLGGSATRDLTFTGSGTAAYAATNDLGNPFLANRLTFDSRSSGLITVASAAGNALALTGTGTALRVVGPGSATLSSAVQLAADAGLAVAGAGNLTLTGVVSQAGGTRGLTVSNASAFATLDTGVVTLAGANTFAGGVTLQSGNLALGSTSSSNTAALGAGTLTVNGGSLRVAGATTHTLANPVTLNADLLFLGGNGSVTLNGAVSGAGRGIDFRGTGTLSVQAAATYTGETVVAASALPLAFPDAGILRLEGAGGALAGTTAVRLRDGGTLVLNNGTSTNSNRLPDAVPVELRGGRLELAGNFAVSVNETAGAVTASGYSILTVNPAFLGLATTLTLAGLDRSAGRGSLEFAGSNLGAASGSAGRIVFAAAPTGDLVGGGGAAGAPDVSVLPYGVYRSGNGDTLVTYTVATGVRPLNLTTEYVGSLASVVSATNNLRLTASDTVAAPTTVNALVVGGAGPTLSGSSPLTVTSGAVVLNSASGVTVNAPLVFGAREAHVHNSVNGVSADVINSGLAGSGGFTKSGPGVLRLTADNSGLTGPLTVNAGSLAFTAANQLPGTGAITFAGTVFRSAAVNANGGLQFEGNSAVTLARDVTLAGLATVILRSGNTSGKLTLAGTISGPGALVATDSFFQNGSLNLTGANTYTGGTTVTFARVIVNNASGSGTGSGPVVVAGSLDTGGILGGRGSVGGPVTVAAYGAVAPGDPDVNGGVGTLSWTSAAVHQFQRLGRYSWQVRAVPPAGTPGADWDFLSANGRLLVSSGFVIDVVAPGAVTGFDNTQPYAWTVATFAGGVDALPDGAFVTNPMGWTGANDLGGGSFSALVQGNNLVVVFTPVPEPGSVLLVCGAVAVTARWLARRRRTRPQSPALDPGRPGTVC